METALIVDAEHDPGFIDRLERGFGACHVECERLLDINMLARLRGALDLLLMLKMGRREDDRVDLRIPKDAIKIAAQIDLLFAAVVLSLAECACRPSDKRYLVALVLNTVGQQLSPTANANDRCSNHIFSGVLVADLLIRRADAWPSLDE